MSSEISTAEYLVWAYRLLLGREPEKPESISGHPQTNRAQIVEQFLNSSEYRSRNSLPAWMKEQKKFWFIHELANGTRFWVRADDSDISQPVTAGSFEPTETAFVKRHVRKGMNVADIGANIGWFTVLMANIVGPSGHVDAIEPRKDLCWHLRRTVCENKLRNVSIYECALSAADGCGFVCFPEDDPNPGGTHLHVNGPHASGVRYQPVDVKQLDSIVRAPIDFIKIDVEGAEKLVFDGAKIILTKCRPIIMTEINPQCLKRTSKISEMEYLQYFKDIGYDVRKILTDGSYGEHVNNYDLYDAAGILNVACVPAEKSLEYVSIESYIVKHLDIGKIRTFAKTVAGRLPLVRALVDRGRAALAKRDVALSALPAVAAVVPGDDTALTTRYSPPAEHLNTATYEDIFYCFRLLLGRCPNPEEWAGHSSRAGEDIENVVSGFVTSREFSERGLLRKTYREKVELVQFPSFSVYASSDDLAVGNHVVIGRCYEPRIAAVLSRYVKPGMAVVDIGANIGYLTMLLASLVTSSGRVVAVEPNPENIKLLEASRRVNGFDQIVVIQAAAGRGTALLALNVSYSNGMTGELPDNLDAIFDSCPVPCFALDAVLPKDRRINLVKIDIEGAELNALLGLSETIDRDRPVIVSEFSPDMLLGISHCSGPEYLRYLTGKGYRVGVIEADGSETIFGDDVDGVMAAYLRSGIDHIDIIATPRLSCPERLDGEWRGAPRADRRGA